MASTDALRRFREQVTEFLYRWRVNQRLQHRVLGAYFGTEREMLTVFGRIDRHAGMPANLVDDVELALRFGSPRSFMRRGSMVLLLCGTFPPAMKNEHKPRRLASPRPVDRRRRRLH